MKVEGSQVVGLLESGRYKGIPHQGCPTPGLSKVHRWCPLACSGTPSRSPSGLLPPLLQRKGAAVGDEDNWGSFFVQGGGGVRTCEDENLYIELSSSSNIIFEFRKNRCVLHEMLR